MLDQDIPTAEALRHLTAPERAAVPEADPAGWSRRRFLQLVGMGVVSGAAIGGLAEGFLPDLLPGGLQGVGAALTPVGPNDGIVVTLVMHGGNDGFNTVVPYANGSYYSQRGGLAVPANQVLALDGTFGLHPNLPFLKSLYDRGEVAVVHGVGYPNPDLSHFSSMAFWMAAKSGAPTSGWVGRWLDGSPAGAQLFGAAAIGNGVPLHYQGEVRRAISTPIEKGVFGADQDDTSLRLYAGLRGYSSASAARGPWHDAIASTVANQLEVASTVDPLMTQPFPSSGIAAQLVGAARLINADLGLRFIDTGWGDFDSHSNQPEMHPTRMTQLDEALRLFFTALDDRFRSRVIVMTMSEFGRTPYANGSNGTDHGTTSCLFVVGAGVKGGQYGTFPTLSGLARWQRPGFSVDFRSVYTSVLDGWMGGGASTVLGGTFENLGLFKASPGAGVAAGPAPAAVLGDYVPISPRRFYDSRNGTGGRFLPLGAGTSAEIQITGVGGVPLTGVTAVAINVTATDASAATYFTAWPVGERRPGTSVLNLNAGETVPNLVITKVGAGGRIHVYNAAGTGHCIADVVGYFRDTAASRMLPLTPARVLDTRTGVGAPKAKLGKGGVIEVPVVGRGGVPAGADAVALNVTVTEPTQGSFLTVWPTGESRPNASSVNMRPGQTVPNLVIARIGAGGKVSIYNAAGDTHVIADVLGAFSPSAVGRHLPVGPTRILDTRTGLGAAKAKVGQNEIVLQVRGVGGVPADASATAVVLNVTVTGPSTGTFVTVWPDGVARPTASNLNASAGQTVANLVLATIGASGKVRLFNAAGTTDLVADVMGYFAG